MVLTLNESNPMLSPKFQETLERIRLTSKVSQSDWFDILEIPWQDYQDMRLGKFFPTENLVERVAAHFELKPLDIIDGRVDYKALALRLEQPSEMPETYSAAAFGRKRTSITSINFLEKYVGWRLRLDSIRRLGITEHHLQDPFSPISMKFITDLCAYLYRRQFRKEDFYAMGAFTYEGNKNSVVAQLFAELSTAKQAYEFFFNDCMKLFEQNCFYNITYADEEKMTVEYITNPHVAAESGVRHLGNEHVCQLKAGAIANVPRYLGLPPSNVIKSACVHKGDDVCRLEIEYPKMRVHNRN